MVGKLINREGCVFEMLVGVVGLPISDLRNQSTSGLTTLVQKPPYSSRLLLDHVTTKRGTTSGHHHR
jgi:hypothetical protein